MTSYPSKLQADLQTLVSSILLKVQPDTHETVLAPRSIGRHRIETAKSGILGHIRRRWLQIRDGGGFSNLENWSIKEIADGMSNRQLTKACAANACHDS